MPLIQTLKLNQFRNFNQFEINLEPDLNLILGANGSGKTSILEAIHFLAYGKSFRSKELNRMVTQGQRNFTLFLQGQDENQSFQIAMQRGSSDSLSRLNGEATKNLSSFAETLPLLLIHPESFQFLTGGAKLRRQLLDWGVFYHYPESRGHFTQIRKALKQRNHALKQQASREHIKLWETTCHQSCETIDSLRQQYLKMLSKQTLNMLKEFGEAHDLKLEYDRGWPDDRTLSEAWDKSFMQDLRSGYTTCGPHQADIKITARSKPAKDILSRGQQKTLICILKLAQGLLFEDSSKQKPIYLFDDLASELDATHRLHVIQNIQEQGAQVIITGIEKDKNLQHAAQHLL